MSGSARILVACIGNIFLGDDAFGCEVACALAKMGIPKDVEVVDYGIRGFDLAYALLKPYQAVILVDAIARGSRPGAVYVLQPDERGNSGEGGAILDPHSIKTAQLIAMARLLGDIAAEIFIVGCEPADFGDELEGRIGLSETVAAAVPEAARTVLQLIAQIDRQRAPDGCTMQETHQRV